MSGQILVVDDERSILVALERLLSGKGYMVETAPSAEEAIPKLKHSHFHLVIADLSLKRMSGMDLLNWVKAHTPDTAVVMITAYGSEKVAVEAMKLGAADYLPKPFDNDELEVIVDRPFIKVNCAAFSRELVESELFGHEKGAFSGAISQRQGKFEVADSGTLFLDEIGDMSLETQAKILRALQEKEFERVGGNKTLKVDVRIIAATNHNLAEKTQQGMFREDLYYRLNVVPLDLPPLRERPEDIPLLLNRFLQEAAQRLRQEPKQIAPEAYRALLDYDWPGNVRELKNTIERAVALASGPHISLADLPSLLPLFPLPDLNTLSFKEAKQRVIEKFEREFIGQALVRNRGNISKTAEELGMYRQHLQLKLHELGVDASRRKGSGD